MTKQKMVKWVKALRSKKFRQGRGTLVQVVDYDKYQHCCLGVLGEVCGIEREDLRGYDLLQGEFQEDCELINEEGIPKEGKVKVRLGRFFAEFASLAAANDGGASFRSIASWIEKNYKLL